MPWGIEDVDRHMKDLSPSKKKIWVEVANDRLRANLAKGMKMADAEASAIKQANAVVGGLKESGETVSLREKIQAALEETVVSESATFKSMVQAFLRSADGIAKHKSVPAKVKASIQNLRTLLHQTWSDIEAAGAVGTVEADEGASGGGGSLEETEFDERGGALLANSAQLVENGRMVRRS